MLVHAQFGGEESGGLFKEQDSEVRLSHAS